MNKKVLFLLTVSKNTYLPNNLDLLSVSALPMYYKAAKTIAKFIF